MHDDPGQPFVDDDETLDDLLRGRIRLLQPRRGARVSLDPLLLVGFVLADSNVRLGRVLDLGCGGGVIALALAQADPRALVAGIEIQPVMADFARRNAVVNGVAGRFNVIEGDLVQPRVLPVDSGSIDLVVSNPPYQPQAKGRAAPEAQRALSRHEVACTLTDILDAARYFLRSRGRLALILPADRLPELMAALETRRLRPRRLRAVHSVANEPARRVLVEAGKDYRGGLTLHPALVVHEADRRTYTDEVAALLGGP
ncbi:MAG: methyltransferase [Deltaproteobacteria bacterium]|nr:methyltransferase [Deltaproteobacteria bacterium]